MNTIVSFEIAKMLKERGFNETSNYLYNNNAEIKKGILPNKLTNYYSAPTISDVLMWLYEKHGIWIYSVKSKYGWLGCVKDYSNKELKTIYTTHSEQMFLAGESDKWYNSPTEAYESSIKYVLTNLI